MMIHTLECYEVSVAYVNAHTWEQLLDTERVPFVMSLIKTV